jgi:hypothetical protein
MPAIMPEEFVVNPTRTVQDLAVGEEGIILKELSVHVNLKGETFVVPFAPLLKRRLSANYLIVRKDADGYCLRLPKGTRFEQTHHVYSEAVPVMRIEVID